MKNYFLAGIIGLVVVLTLSTQVSWAWEKDSGVSCERVFASIQNDGVSRNWNGVVTANGVDVVNTSGSDASTNFVTVEWIPTPGFSGSVEATITLSNVEDGSKTISGNLDCPESSPTSTPTQEITPTPTAPPSNPGGTGDGRTDSLGCQHASDNCGGSSPSQAVLGASTGPQVLGLSTTSGEESALPQLIQLFAAFASGELGLFFFKRNG